MEHAGEAAASAVILKDDAVLLVRRRDMPAADVWTFPGGHVEAGESASSAALREVAEETGVTARLLGSLGMHEVARPDLTPPRRYRIAVFAGVWVAGEAQAASDVREAGFVPLHEARRLPLTAGARDFIAAALALRARA